jgi:hypothetical protein
MENSVKPGLRLIDRLLLVGAWLLSCSAVYGLGFYTGSQIQERAPDDEERIVRLPVTADPPEAGQHAKAGDDFTFYDTLVPGSSRPRPGDAVTAERSPVEPPAPSKSDPARNHAAARGNAAKAPAKAPAKGAAKAPSKVPAPHARAGRSAGGTVRTTGKTESATPMTAKASTRASAGTGASRSKPHAATSEPKPERLKSRHPSATRAAAATPSKRPASGPGAVTGPARTAAARTQERPAARASHPRDGAARSAVASE